MTVPRKATAPRSSGKKAACPVCGKVVTVLVDGHFWGHTRPTYRYTGSVECEGVRMRNDDPLADDHGRLIWKAAKAREAVQYLPRLIADAQKKVDVLAADLARAPAIAAETAVALAEWEAAHPKETP